MKESIFESGDYSEGIANYSGGIANIAAENNANEL